jgi:hypothetical protein
MSPKNQNKGKGAVVAMSETAQPITIINSVDEKVAEKAPQNTALFLNTVLTRINACISRLVDKADNISMAIVQHTEHLATQAMQGMIDQAWQHLETAYKMIKAMQDLNVPMTLTQAMTQLTESMPDRPTAPAMQARGRKRLIAGNVNQTIVNDSQANMGLINDILVKYDGVSLGSLPADVTLQMTVTDKTKYGKINGFYRTLITAGKENDNMFNDMLRYNVPVTPENVNLLTKGIKVSDGNVLLTTASSKGMMLHAVNAYLSR